jgi:hypothetical protein
MTPNPAVAPQTRLGVPSCGPVPSLPGPRQACVVMDVTWLQTRTPTRCQGAAHAQRRHASRASCNCGTAIDKDHAHGRHRRLLEGADTKSLTVCHQTRRPPKSTTECYGRAFPVGPQYLRVLTNLPAQKYSARVSRFEFSRSPITPPDTCYMLHMQSNYSRPPSAVIAGGGLPPTTRLRRFRTSAQKQSCTVAAIAESPS